MSHPELPEKKDVADALLSRGSVFVHLDPRVEGTVVPAWLKGQPQLVLQFGLGLAIPIPDLRIDDDGVFGTLSFQRSPFACTVPWEAVFALVGDDGRGVVWPDDLPSEIAAEVEREAGRRAPPAPVAEVEDGEARAPVASLADARKRQTPAKKPEKRGKKTELPPYLRVIK